MWSPIKLWVLFNMRILDSSAFCLFPREHRVAERPPQALIDTADRKLVLFANWLLKDYSAQSASQYVSAIKSKHTDWLGGRSLQSWGVSFPLVTARLGTARKAGPGARRQKVPFTVELLADCFVHAWVLNRWWHARATTYAVMAFCLEQLLRINEATSDPKAPSIANGDPITVSDVTFFAKDGTEVAHPRNLRDGIAREGLLDHMVCRMPPSKCDAAGDNADLFSPAGGPWMRSAAGLPEIDPDVLAGQAAGEGPRGGLPVPLGPVRWPSSERVLRERTGAQLGHAAVGACRAIWALLAVFPVPARLRHVSPLFADAKGSAIQLSRSSFWRSFGTVMRAAGHADFRKFGLHCFRVGGVVAMQEAGASMPEVMAQGRWKSDVVRVYCRRGKDRSMRWGQRIMRRSPAKARQAGRAASAPRTRVQAPARVRAPSVPAAVPRVGSPFPAVRSPRSLGSGGL